MGRVRSPGGLRGRDPPSGCVELRARTSLTMRAARSLGISPSIRIRLSRRANASIWRRRSGVSERSGIMAAASFSGVQSHWISSGMMFSPSTRFVSTIEGALMRYLRISSELRHPIGDHHRDARQSKLQGHRAGGGERGLSAPERRPFGGFALDDRWAQRPVLGATDDLLA